MAEWDQDIDFFGVLHRKKNAHGRFEDPYKTKVDVWLKGKTLHVKASGSGGEVEELDLMEWKVLHEDRGKITLLHTSSPSSSPSSSVVQSIKLKAESATEAETWLSFCRRAVVKADRVFDVLPAQTGVPPLYPAAGVSVDGARKSLGGSSSEAARSKESETPLEGGPAGQGDSGAPGVMDKLLGALEGLRGAGGIEEGDAVDGDAGRGGEVFGLVPDEKAWGHPRNEGEAVDALVARVREIQEKCEAVRGYAAEDSITQDAEVDHLDEKLREAEKKLCESQRRLLAAEDQREVLEARLGEVEGGGGQRAGGEGAEALAREVDALRARLERAMSDLERERLARRAVEDAAVRSTMRSSLKAGRDVGDEGVLSELTEEEEESFETPRGQAADAEERVERLNQELERVRKERDEARAAPGGAGGEVEDLRASVEEERKRREKAEFSLEEARFALEEQLAAAAASAEEMERLSARPDAGGRDAEQENMQKRVQEAEAAAASAEAGTKELSRLLEESRAECEALSLSTLDRDVGAEAEKAAAAARRVGVLEQECETLSSEVVRLRQLGGGGAELVRKLEQEVARLKAEGVVGGVEELRKEREAKERVQRQYQALELSLASKIDLEKFKAKEAAASASEARMALQGSLDAATARTDELERELSALRARNEEAEEMCEALRMQLAAVRERNTEMEREGSILKREVKILKGKEGGFGEAERQREAAVEEVEGLRKELMGVTRRLEGSVKMEGELRNQLLQQAAAFESERDKLHGHVFELESRIGRIRQGENQTGSVPRGELGRRETFETKLSKQNHRIASLQAEVEGLKSERREHLNTISRLQQEACLTPRLERERDMAREVISSRASPQKGRISATSTPRKAGSSPQSDDSPPKGRGLENSNSGDGLRHHLVPAPSKVAKILLGSSERNRLATAEYLASLLSNASEISRVGKGLTPDDMQEIVRYVEEHPSVEKLFLSGNRLGEGGGRLVADLLRSAGGQLTRIDLRHNALGDSACIGIAQALAQHGTAIARLDLSANGVTSAAAAAIAATVSSCPKLERLDVRNNEMGDAGAEAVAQAVAKGHIRHLDLSSNGVSSLGARALARALGANATLLVLDVRDNPIAPEGVSALQRASRESGVVGRQVLVPTK